MKENRGTRAILSLGLYKRGENSQSVTAGNTTGNILLVDQESYRDVDILGDVPYGWIKRIEKISMTPRHSNIGFHSLRVCSMGRGPATHPAEKLKTCMVFAAMLGRQQTIPGRCPHISQPVQEKAIFPGLDSNGNLLSTVTLDIDNTRNVSALDSAKKYIENLKKKLRNYPTLKVICGMKPTANC